MSSVEERLKTCQSALQNRGVTDVKFFFGSLFGKPLTELASDVADALECVAAGKSTELPPINYGK